MMKLRASSLDDFAAYVIYTRQILVEKEKNKADESGREISSRPEGVQKEASRSRAPGLEE